MAHPNKAEGIKGHNAKLRRMTAGYGAAGGPSQYRAARENYPKGNAAADHPEGDPGFGVDPAGATARSDRPARRAAPGNAVATYHKGGKVRHRAAGGGLPGSSPKSRKGAKKGSTNISINLTPSNAPTGVSGLPMGANPAMPPPRPPIPLPPPMPSGGIPGAAGAALPPPGGGPGPLSQLALQQRAAGLLPRKRGGRVKGRQMGGPSFNYGQQDMKASQQAMQKANQQNQQAAGMGKSGLLNSLMGKANPSGSTSGVDPSAKRGGRVHGDAKDDRRLVRSMVKGSSLKHRAKGGSVLKGKGAESGEGRINRNRHMDHKLKPTTGVAG